MKNLFISCLTLLLLTGCSSEDNAPVNQEPQGTGTGALKKIDEIWYADFNLPMRNVYEYSEDGKLLKASQYLHASATQPTYVRYYTYTSNGLLESYKILDNGTETTGKLYTYDSQGRMSTLTYTNAANPTVLVEFEYDSSTITANSTSLSSGNEWISKIFYLNNNGLIFKETDPNYEDSTLEAVYDGSNIISFEDHWGTGSYTYDEEHDPSLMNLNMGVGTQKNNAILRELSIFESEGLINTKYITSMSYNDNDDDAGDLIRTMEYTFSSEGLVLTKTTHDNDALKGQAQYYYYQ